MKISVALAVFSILFQSCNRQPQPPQTGLTDVIPAPPKALFISQIPLPAGFVRVAMAKGSFGAWLRQLPLRKDNVLRLYNGVPKPNQTLHYAVLDVAYTRNVLQQCADAVMRMRAEYIYATKCEPAISFLRQNNYYNCGSNCSRAQLESFLHTVFANCGTYNLSAQLKPVPNIQGVMPGDVFVHAGAPGHAMLVADVAINNKGEKFFLLLQSFMPAQEIHLVINPFKTHISPWYAATESTIYTPGYYFKPTDLKRW